MNLRISNLSCQREINITATDSVDLFNGTGLSTTTDTTLSLIPKEGRKIEGTLKLDVDDLLVRLATDLRGENVIISTDDETRLIVPLYQNIAIEWDNNITGFSAY